MSHPHLPRLVDCARAVRAAGHGEKRAICERYCRELGYVVDGEPALRRLRRELARHGLCGTRAQRADAGQHTLDKTEAEEIVRWQRENARANGKSLVSLKAAVDTLRANGHIKAECLNEETGEIRPLSYSAIAQAIQTYGLSADMLDTPPPATRMRVLHANHVWEIDASLCVLYYLPKDGGLRIMSETLFNSNKPKNIAKIEQERVWRYLVVDVASGAIYVEYVFGGESGANLTGVFIAATQERPNEFWGVPKMIYCDAGAANTGAVFKGLCQQLDIEVQWHLPGNARATGAVEKPQDIVERQFESMLASRPVTSLAELNAAAARWRVKFNATAEHSRHKQTRLSAWAKHVAGHLKAPPNVETCRALAYTKPEKRRVTQYLTVQFDAKDWDASGFPQVYRGMTVHVARNPWSEDSIRIIEKKADGTLAFFECPLKRKNELGYWEDSPVLGQEFKRHAMTPPEKTLARLAERTAADQLLADGTKRAKPMPFGGKIDPYKSLDETAMADMLPRRPDEVHPATAQVSLPTLTHTQAAIRLRGLIGRALEPTEYEWMTARFTGGVPSEQIEALAAQFVEQAGEPVVCEGTTGGPVLRSVG
ncbi:integrase [Paraburkholderia fungorum]|uniref:integrase n=1 Tax=Paraburkholderia fungorum TaxID=134537 RepID=UPI00402B554E